MARISEAPEGGKFRARAAAALNGTAGAWGDGDLLCVTFDAAGDLIVGAAATARGVIWTPEGRRDPTDADYKNVVGGRMYTVFTWAVIQEIEMGNTSPAFGAGDAAYAAASGDVVATTGGAAGGGVGAVYIGQVLNDETVPGGAGLRMIVNVNGFVIGLA